MTHEVDEQPKTGKRTRLLWLITLAAVVVIQWPMLKGLYYKNFSSQETTTQSTVPWRADFAQAQKEASESGKPILLDFSAPWCPPCQVMKHEVWTDPAVGEAVETNVIPYLVDVDLPLNRDLGARYEVEQIPALILIDAKGNVLKRGSYMTADEVKRFVTAEARVNVKE